MYFVVHCPLFLLYYGEKIANYNTGNHNIEIQIEKLLGPQNEISSESWFDDDLITGHC
jgi:hypothetical protein